MNRREAIIAVLAAPLGKFTAFAAQSGPAPSSKALLTINLDTWAGIKVTMGKRLITVTSADIFEALTVKEG